MHTRSIPRAETGVLIGWRLKPKNPEKRLETFPPFFLLLAYGQDGKPAPYPEIAPLQADEFALCQRCGLRGDPARIPPYTPYLFQYQADERGRFSLAGQSALQITRLRSRSAALAWVGIDLRIPPGERRGVYDRLADALPWAVPVPLPELLLPLAEACESGRLSRLDWSNVVQKPEG